METVGFSETSMNFDQTTRYCVFMKTRLAGTELFMRTYWWADRHGGKLIGAYMRLWRTRYKHVRVFIRPQEFRLQMTHLRVAVNVGMQRA